jgi:hypothetical protein
VPEVLVYEKKRKREHTENGQMILAYTEGSAVDKPCSMRGNFLDKRRVAMQVWRGFAAILP